MTDEQILELALAQVQELLPDSWTIQAIGQTSGPGGNSNNMMVTVTQRGMSAPAAIVELRRSFTPQDARKLLGGSLAHRLREMTGNTPIVVIAPYLSLRTRELLSDQRVSYVDLTGDVRLEMQNLFVNIERTARNPSPRATPSPGLRGASGGRLVRVLADARPPYGVTEIAKAAGVDPGYASRILEALSDEALIEREPRGKVTDADWPALLRARARHLDLLGRRSARKYVARQGARQALASLSDLRVDGLWAVTGSFAAVEIAPIAAPALLVIYAMDPNSMAARLDLLPADEGADVVLIRPPNYGPFDRTRELNGIEWAGLSQVVLDCLSGNGRMPAEGEALIEWMASNEPKWRREIGQLPPPAGSS
jgi:hypothetical protein